MAVKYQIDLTKMNFPARLSVTEDTVEIVRVDPSAKNSMGKVALTMLGVSKIPTMVFQTNISNITKVYLNEANGWAGTGFIQFCVKGGSQERCKFYNTAFMNNVFHFNSNYNKQAQQIKQYVESIIG